MYCRAIKREIGVGLVLTGRESVTSNHKVRVLELYEVSNGFREEYIIY